jgi:hypothetical protein
MCARSDVPAERICRKISTNSRRRKDSMASAGISPRSSINGVTTSGPTSSPLASEYCRWAVNRGAPEAGSLPGGKVRVTRTLRDCPPLTLYCVLVCQ